MAPPSSEQYFIPASLQECDLTDLLDIEAHHCETGGSAYIYRAGLKGKKNRALAIKCIVPRGASTLDERIAQHIRVRPSTKL